MEKKSRNILFSIITFFLLLILVPFPLLGANGACVTYSSSSKTITVSCTSETHLNDVNNALNDPTILKKDSNGVWLLVQTWSWLKEVTWLLIQVTLLAQDNFEWSSRLWLENLGNLKIDNVKITSWNIASNTYASPGTDGTTQGIYCSFKWWNGQN